MDEQRKAMNVERPTEPGEATRRERWARDDNAPVVEPKRSASLWDRFLHLMGIVGTDRRGGPGG